MKPILLAVFLLLAAFGPSCARRENSDARDIRRMAIDQGVVGVDTLTMNVRLIHPEVAAVTSARRVIQQHGDTLLVPEIMIYVRKDGKWTLTLEG